MGEKMVEQFSAASGEMVWVIVVIAIILAVGVVMFMLNPNLSNAADKLFCESYYNVLYFFGGPRPPIEVCSKGKEVPLTTTAPGTPLLPGMR